MPCEWQCVSPRGAVMVEVITSVLSVRPGRASGSASARGVLWWLRLSRPVCPVCQARPCEWQCVSPRSAVMVEVIMPRLSCLSGRASGSASARGVLWWLRLSRPVCPVCQAVWMAVRQPAGCCDGWGYHVPSVLSVRPGRASGSASARGVLWWLRLSCPVCPVCQAVRVAVRQPAGCCDGWGYHVLSVCQAVWVAVRQPAECCDGWGYHVPSVLSIRPGRASGSASGCGVLWWLRLSRLSCLSGRASGSASGRGVLWWLRLSRLSCLSGRASGSASARGVLWWLRLSCPVCPVCQAVRVAVRQAVGCGDGWGYHVLSVLSGPAVRVAVRQAAGCCDGWGYHVPSVLSVRPCEWQCVSPRGAVMVEVIMSRLSCLSGRASGSASGRGVLWWLRLSCPVCPVCQAVRVAVRQAVGCCDGWGYHVPSVLSVRPCEWQCVWPRGAVMVEVITSRLSCQSRPCEWQCVRPRGAVMVEVITSRLSCLSGRASGSASARGVLWWLRLSRPVCPVCQAVRVAVRQPAGCCDGWGYHVPSVLSVRPCEWQCVSPRGAVMVEVIMSRLSCLSGRASGSASGRGVLWWLRLSCPVCPVCQAVRVAVRQAAGCCDGWGYHVPSVLSVRPCEWQCVSPWGAVMVEVITSRLSCQSRPCEWQCVRPRGAVMVEVITSRLSCLSGRASGSASARGVLWWLRLSCPVCPVCQAVRVAVRQAAGCCDGWGYHAPSVLSVRPCEWQCVRPRGAVMVEVIMSRLSCQARPCEWQCVRPRRPLHARPQLRGGASRHGELADVPHAAGLRPGAAGRWVNGRL